MKKVLILHHYSEIGGAGNSMLQTARLLKDSFDVSLCVPSNSNIQRLSEEQGFKTIPHNAKIGTIEYYSGGPKILSKTYISQLFRRYSFRKYIKALLLAEKPDIVMLNSITLSYLIPVINKLNIRTISFVRETFPANGSKLIFDKYKALLDQANTVFFISEFDKSKFNLHSTKSIVLKNSIQDSFLSEYSKLDAFNVLNISYDTNKFYVLFVGGLQSFKGSDVLKQAIKLCNPNIEFLVCGADKKDLVSFYTSRINALGILSDMRVAYAACDCLIFPSIKAHQARPIFEAGAFKKPVIVSSFPEVQEYITDGFNGLLSIPGDVNSLVNKINYMSTHLSEASIMGENNYQLTIKNHAEKVAREVLLDNIS